MLFITIFRLANGLSDRLKAKQKVHRQTDNYTYGHTRISDKEVAKLKKRKTDRLTDRQTQIESHTDRRTEIQKNRQTGKTNIPPVVEHQKKQLSGQPEIFDIKIHFIIRGKLSIFTIL